MTAKGRIAADTYRYRITLAHAGFSYTLQWAGICPPKIALFLKNTDPPPNPWFLWPTRVHIPNGISIGSAILAQLMVFTNRQSTQRPRCICSNKPHLCTACIRCGLIIGLQDLYRGLKSSHRIQRRWRTPEACITENSLIGFRHTSLIRRRIVIEHGDQRAEVKTRT